MTSDFSRLFLFRSWTSGTKKCRMGNTSVDGPNLGLNYSTSPLEGGRGVGGVWEGGEESLGALWVVDIVLVKGKRRRHPRG